MPGIHDNHRQRLRNRFLEEGLQSFEPHEVMELLLTYSIDRRDVNPLAHTLIKTFGSIDKVLEAPPDLLARVDGVGERTVVFLKLIPAVTAYYLNSKNREIRELDTTEKLADYLIPKFLDKTIECSYLVCLDNRLRLLSCTQISEGTETQTPFPIRKVTDILLRTRATAAVVAHNHPNGFPVPSSTDLTVTEDLCQHLKRVEVKLLDHIIVSGADYVSMRDIGAFQP